jgi:hypothetical protein
MSAEEKQKDYLSEISNLYEEIRKLDLEYNQSRVSLKKRLAEKIEEGRFESDLTVKNVADHLGIKRQTVNKVLIDVYGVRHPEKAKAAALGHVNRG